MKKQLTFIVALLAFSTLLSAQKDETLFSATGIRLTGAWAGPAIGGTVSDGDIVRQSGSLFALEFNKNMTIGWSNNSVDFPSVNASKIDFSYSGLFLNYAPASYKAIHPSFGILASGGRFGLEAQNNKDKSDLWVAQPSIGLELNAFRWLKLNLSGGYRFAFFLGEGFEGVSDNDISAPFVNLSFKFGFSWGTE